MEEAALDIERALLHKVRRPLEAYPATVTLFSAMYTVFEQLRHEEKV
jgi:hypothetical protein